ncbi:hypothetical protein IQ215_12110 [Cyanobacterium stanieri LEGE 03274]|uniref:Ribbon-helix-helix protein CopG domain-containing protein n=1 Tax=Cyanobacterium stanieri LEGE 03274 TaxID=1828756 RepID=A0ABR9V7F5_9CHRO|nr:hypothetical protein [Cyanobacterium stanieri]MBE9223441.1 hypothetical protein [Cyanobacterium stanieri LEGE 03274]
MTRKKTKTGTGLGSSKSKVNITLTPEANETLVALAKETGLTKSKLFEQILIGGFVINSQNADKKVILHDESEGEQKFSIAQVDEDNQDSGGDSISSKEDATASDKQQYLDKIAKLEKQLDEQKSLVADKSKDNQDLVSKVKAQEDEIKSIEKKLDDKNNQVKGLEDKLNSVTQTLEKSDQSSRVEKLNQELDSSHNTINSLKEKVSSLESLIEEKDRHIKSLKEELSGLESKVKDNEDNEKLKSVIEEKQQEIDRCRREIATKEQEKIALSQNYATQQNTISRSLTQENAQQKALIASLNKRLADLETVASIGERMLNKWRK